jgi:hypothetical protein
MQRGSVLARRKKIDGFAAQAAGNPSLPNTFFCSLSFAQLVFFRPT